MSRLSPKIRGEKLLVAGLAAACLAIATYQGRELFLSYNSSIQSMGARYLFQFVAIQTLVDSCAWLAAAFACLMAARLAWIVKRRIPFGLTGYLAMVVVLAYSLRRVLELNEFGLDSGHADPRGQAISAVVAGFVAVVALFLAPLLRRVMEFGVTVAVEHDRFLTAAETNANPFFILEPVIDAFGRISDLRICYLNDKARNMIGITKNRLINVRVSRIFPAVRTNGVLHHLMQVSISRVPYLGEVSAQDRHGRTRLYSLQAVKMSVGVAVVISDLSEEREKRRQLEDMHRFSESMIENAPFSIVATDAHGTILAVNAATEALTQYCKRDLVGVHSLVMLHDATELSARSVALSNALGRPIPAGFETLTEMLGARKSDEREWTYRLRDGSFTAVNLALTALRGPDGAVTGYLAIAFDISERKRLTDSITHMAHHDGLTNLPNRVLLGEKMDGAILRASASGKRIALLMVDIDKFKRINDSLGHAAGDTLLRTIAERLTAAVRKADVVARVGGDEFVVMLEDLEEDWDAMECAAQILKTVEGEIVVSAQSVMVTASIGICIFPDFGTDSADLLRNADVAMYEVKKRGMNGIQSYSSSIIAATSKSLQLERELRCAIDGKELELYYQPQVDSQSGEIVGVEALLRWNHPKRGMVPPLEFIGIAEDTGLIVPIGEWVLRQGCTQMAALQSRLGKRLSLAVNLSGRQFRQKGLATIVQEALHTSGLRGEDLQLELTESTLMNNTSETMAQLGTIRRLGVQLALDDFGTGFSNFQYILDYKVDCLKIDRSFVSKCPADPTAAAVVRAVIAMAHGLGMRVVAEGVETAEQQAFLLRRHCDRYQGYLFDKPMSLQALESRLLQVKGNRAISHLKDDRMFVDTSIPANAGQASYGESNGK